MAQFTDIVSAFDAGVNSGVAPLLLQKNQLAIAVNTSLRGGYAKTRAAILKQSLIYTDPLLQVIVEKGFFQGAGYYRPDFGAESLIAQISGHLIKLTPSGSSWSVTDISIPGDLNSATQNQVWMWQSEKWMIVQDGSGKLPIFFDGVSSRRSYGASVLLATVSAVSSAGPNAIGAIITAALTAPYTGPFNIPVIFNKEFYQPVQSLLGYSVVLKNITGTPTNTEAAGSQIIINPATIAEVTAVTSGNSGTGYLTFQGTLSSIVGIVDGYYNSSTNSFVGNPYLATVIFNGGTPTIEQVYIRVLNPSTKSVQFQSSLFRHGTIQINQFSLITDPNNTSPNVIIANTKMDFATPAVGSSIMVLTTAPYTGQDGQIVYVNGAAFEISNPPNVVRPTALFLINLSDTTAISGLPLPIMSVPELPAGRMGAYGMGRNWMSLTDGISYVAGDIVGGAAGTQANNYRDSVLKTTENDFLSGGGTFRLPGTGDIITAMLFPPILDTSLGQGQLEIGTAFSMFSNNSPVDRSTWESLTSPLQTESLKDNGPLAQNSTILVNSDTFFRSSAGIGSLILARRDFIQTNAWGNKTVSNEMQRILNLDNRSLLSFGSAVSFDNRFLSTASPNVSGGGVFHGGIVSLNNDLMSSLRGSLPSAWEGAFSGINVLQLVQGRFNGSLHCYAFTYNVNTSKVELHEILSEADALAQGIFEDDDETPITWFFETAVLFNRDIKPMEEFIQLNNGEISLSNIRGQVDVVVKYRPLNYPCWIDWHDFTVCADMSAGDSQPQHRYRLGLGTPDGTVCDPSTNLPYRVGLAFQFRVEITGYCTFQDMKVEAVDVPMPKYAPVACDTTEQAMANCVKLECTTTPDLRVYSTQGLPPQPLPPVVPPSMNYKNDAVYFNNLCQSGTPSFSGTLPNWITLDAGNNRFVGAAGTFVGASVIAANEAAQNALNQFAQANIGNITCGTVPASCSGTDLNGYKISGYADGMIVNGSGSAPSGQATWDGSYAPCSDGSCTLFSNVYNTSLVINGKLGTSLISYGGGLWTLEVLSNNSRLWRGTKDTGATAAGAYTNDGSGDDALPDTLTMVSNGVVAPIACT